MEQTQASTWESGSKEQNSKVLSPEEEERIKEEKAGKLSKLLEARFESL